MHFESNDLSAFDQLRIRSLQTAYDLSNSIKISCKNSGQESMGTTVALLCPSSVDFLFIWLGLMRLGYSVLLIAYVC